MCNLKNIVINTPAAGDVDSDLPLSQAVVIDKTLYISGQIGVDPETGELAGRGGYGHDGVRQILKQIKAILKIALP